MLQSDLAYMTAMSSLYAHERSDIEHGSEHTNKLFLNAMSRLPYVTQGKSGDDVANIERDKSIEKYREMKRRVMKKKD
jgi:hypothetical protein